MCCNRLRKQYQTNKKDFTITIAIIMQSLIFIFIKWRFVSFAIMILTTFFYLKVARIIKGTFCVIIYSTLVFLLFSYHHNTMNIKEFLGFTNNLCNKERDSFFHENNTLFFALMPNKKSKVKVMGFLQEFNEKIVRLSDTERLLSIININHQKSFENMCLYHNNLAMVYINNALVTYNKSKNNVYNSYIQELKKKDELLRNLNIESEAAILFSIKISENSAFLKEYAKLPDESKKINYILKNIGYEFEKINSAFLYAIFYANEDKFLQFRQKNQLIITIL